MKLFINTNPLHDANAGRGVGHYTRMLINALNKYSHLTLVDSIQEAELVHYPFFDLFYLTLPFIKTKPTVVTIHDVIPLLYPHAYPKGIRGTFKQFMQTLRLNSVEKIITDSECSTNDVVAYLKQPANKVATVYLAPDPLFRPQTKETISLVKNKYNLNVPYYMYVGDINYNKNLPVLFAQFADFVKNGTLVMVSKTLKRDNPAALNLWSLIDKLGIENRLKILTDIETNELAALYSGAEWYIQPSLYEGFGLPVLEAQACECPVISSRGGSLNEVCAESCFDFDLMKQIESVDRSNYIQRGIDNVKRFSWQKSATLMEEIYNSCIV